MDKITLSNAIEILDLNLKEGTRMPADVKLSLNLAVESLVGLRTERTFNGYARIGQLPSEEVGQLESPARTKETP